MFRLMCVTAHPDDEAGSFGGTLRKYADLGVETCVVCLTPGQAASNRGGAASDHDLAEIRRKEFAASCEILGVTHPLVLNYPDGQLYRQELNRVVYDVALRIRQFRPDVLLTFGAEGGFTGHPDHSMAGVFATLAFHWAGRANRYSDQLSDTLVPHQTAKLYHSTAEGTLPDRPPVTFSPHTAAIDISGQLQAKIKAFKAHQTQSPLWPLFEGNVRSRGPKELFHLQSWVQNGPAAQESDLFAGLQPGGSAPGR
jgi:LmbE family N-acetylglucosaminyl deacetylase